MKPAPPVTRYEAIVSKCRSQPVSRILSAVAPARLSAYRSFGGTTIPLVLQSLAGSSNLPGGFGRAVLPDCTDARCAGTPIATLFGFAPCGVLPAIRVATDAVRSYRTFSPLPQLPEAVYFLCHWSVKLPCPGVTRRTALRSSDFPLPRPLRSYPRLAEAAVIWPTATH